MLSYTDPAHTAARPTAAASAAKHPVETEQALRQARSESIRLLRRLLREGDEADRCNASRALGNIDAREAIDDLVTLLGDEDIDVCIDAAEALGKLDARPVLPKLHDSLMHDPDGELKTAIIKALGLIGAAESIPLLMEIAEQQPENMILDSNEDWNDWWDMQRHAIVALGDMSATEATPLLKRLLLEDEEDVDDIEADILQALLKLGEDGEAAVIEVLQSAPRAISRRRAARALAASSGNATLKSLARALTDDHEDVRLYALESLIERDAVKYLPAIELLTRDRSREVRQCALRGVEKLRARQETTRRKTATDANALARDDDTDTRIARLEALAERAAAPDDDRLIESLRLALADPDPRLAMAALPLLAGLEDREQAETELLVLLGRPKPDPALTIAALRVLQDLGRWNLDLSRLLGRLASQDHQGVRLATLNALMAIQNALLEQPEPPRGKQPVDIVLDALEGRVLLEVEIGEPMPAQSKAGAGDAASDDRIASDASSSAESAENASDQDEEDVQIVTSTLQSILLDNRRVEEALQQQQDRPMPGEVDEELQQYHDLVQANIHRAEWLFAHDRDVPAARDLQYLAARLLGDLPRGLDRKRTARIVNSLIQSLHAEDEQLRIRAAEALARIAGRQRHAEGVQYAYGGLVTQFHSELWDLKIACSRALAALGNRSAIPILIAALDHPRGAVRQQLIESITDLVLDGDELLKNAHVPQQPPTLEEWMERLIELLRDAEFGVRHAAVVSLRRCLDAPELDDRQAWIERSIDSIIDAAFVNRGGRVRDLAEVIKDIEPACATRQLNALLDRLSDSMERRFAIEMIEQIHRRQPMSVVA